MNPPRVLVLGGSGFVGRHVCEQLARLGWQITVATRRAVNAASVQSLPGLTVIEASVHQDSDLARLMPGHDAVVNLVAVLHGSEERFESVHVALPGQIARAMNHAGVRRLVHVSALGADPQGPSMYQRSKARGEAVLQGAGLQLTVLRPSVIFGAEDKFLNLLPICKRWRRSCPWQAAAPALRQCGWPMWPAPWWSACNNPKPPARHTSCAGRMC